jgi:hypothetical protein
VTGSRKHFNVIDRYQFRPFGGENYWGTFGYEEKQRFDGDSND